MRSCLDFFWLFDAGLKNNLQLLSVQFNPKPAKVHLIDSQLDQDQEVLGEPHT